ncbi:hypothetical protein P43SY_001720 [Pythium insidiosum]|uniref:Ion transport domain-containing protein n=1 Tax=Pythium insidiosum TaxID=114742 RepID=A0AAD5LGP6_PYTIN|nr:hypothetical protein P43SY_001720 [Pythium insidiosum]
MSGRNERMQLLPDRRSWAGPAGCSSDLEGFSGPPPPRTIRRDVWSILQYRASDPHRTSLQRVSRVFQGAVLVLILLNVLLAMRQSDLMAAHESDIDTGSYESFLQVSTLVFSLEYLLRVWSCVEDERFASPLWGRLKWMRRPMAVIDVVALIPFYLEILLKHGSSVQGHDVYAHESK